MITTKQLTGIGLAALLTCAMASAAVLNDTFTDGGRSNGADAEDGAWWSTGDSALFTVANDAGSITGNSLRAAGVGSTRSLMCFFPSAVTLANVGDRLTFTADVRLSSTPVGNYRELNFVLGNSAGTRQAADNFGTTTRADDTYYESLLQVTGGTGLQGPGSLYLYRATMPSGSEDFTEGGEVTVGGASPTRGTVNSTLLYSGSPVFSIGMTAERVATGIQLQSTVNGNSTALVIDTTSYVSTFDMFMFQDRAGAASTYYLDNVLVTMSVVPEPSTLALAALGAVSGAIMLRRRKA